MSSEDTDYANMDSDSGDEVSEKEDNDELLGATGNGQPDGAVADTESETSVRSKKKSATSGSEHGEKCTCNCSSPTRSTFEVLQMRCRRCGGVINETRVNRGKTNSSSGSTARVEDPGPSIGVVTYAVGLPALPSTSLEDNTSNQDGGSHSSNERAASLVTGRSQEGRTPAQHFCDNSAQCPSQGMLARIFIVEMTQKERNEKWYLLFIIPEKELVVYERICKSYMDDPNNAASQEGYTTRQLSFLLDNGQIRDFYTVYIHEQIRVSFRIQNRWQENFVIYNGEREFFFSVPAILCASKHRVTPGAKSQFRVECIGEPGRLCQEQGRVTLIIDSRIQHTLVFSISFWAPE